MKRKYETQVTNHESRTRAGSALILAVVLTSLLAIVGVMFLMVARVDRMATSAISENKELNFAVETVIAKISQELVLDVPGVIGQEYYDYPDPCNAWLASLEPYYVGLGDYHWMHTSDIYNELGLNAWNLQAEIIPDYQYDVNEGFIADADGDGVADSRWIKLPNMSSSKGKPIFAAIRIVDNGGMLNVNTAYKFDPNDSLERIDGSSQLQINLMALAGRPPLPTWPVGNPHTLNDETDLRTARANSVDVDPYLQYQNAVIWSYGEPAPYTPFDVSDELELRYRFLLNHPGIDTRLEDWGGEFRGTVIETPVDSGGLDEWFKRASFNPAILDPSIDSKDPNYYAYRHIGTTYNMDRIIDPNGEKMVNINTAGEALLYAAVRTGLYDANVPGPNSLAAQMAVNIVDYRDADSDVTVYNGYYGFERPCIYISELVYKEDVNDPDCRSYAIELYKPYFEDNDPCGWQLVIDGSSIDITWSGEKQFHVVLFEDPNAPLNVSPTASIQTTPFVVFDVGDLIELQRFVADVNNYIMVDSVQVPDWLVASAGIRSRQRNITLHKCVRRLWADASEPNSLGNINTYKPVDWIYIQAHPANADFTNIGEIGMIFRKSAYPESVDVIGPSDTEDEVRIDVNAPIFQQIFNYLTVFDPVAYPWNDPNETRIKGRININTAPWYVIAQLPWMRYNAVGYDYLRVQAIVADRDSAGAFKSIGELMRVPAMRSLDLDASDNLNSDVANPGPDFTDDSATNDFEERDVIFARISNLVTVRSDVFTAYILVRIGADGPQKRVITILDRSNVYSGNDKVRIVALHPVPDPR